MVCVSISKSGLAVPTVGGGDLVPESEHSGAPAHLVPQFVCFLKVTGPNLRFGHPR